MIDRWRVTVTHVDGQAYSFYSYKLKIVQSYFLQRPSTITNITIVPDKDYKYVYKQVVPKASGINRLINKAKQKSSKNKKKPVDAKSRFH